MADRWSERLWHEERIKYGWAMPPAAFWKPLPIVRNIRAAIAYRNVGEHNHVMYLSGFSGQPQQYDLWVCYGIATGKEVPFGV